MKTLLSVLLFLLVFPMACTDTTTITQTMTQTIPITTTVPAGVITLTTNNAKFLCPIDGLEFDSFAELQTHFETTHPERVTLTVGQLLDIPVEPTHQEYLAGMVRVQNTQVRLGTYDQLNRTGTAGDPSFVVTGTMTNENDTAWQIGFSANGYSPQSSEPVSKTLDVGPIVGVLALIIPAGETKDFTIHLNWNEDVNLIRISGGLYSTEVPLP